MDPTPIIVAVASAPGSSARGIVRLSGRRTAELLHAALLDDPPFVRGIAAARLRLGPAELPVTRLVAPGPRSYTGEDTAELHLAGHPALLHRVVDTLLDLAAARGLDARHAHGGEFTARAYFNNRLSLTEAEGVAATIAAVSDAELRGASLLARGDLARFAHTLADDLAGALALVEAGIDFTDEEDVVPIAAPDLAARLVTLRARLADHLSRAVGMESLRAIPWVVLAGRPNAGKSTLFNALLRHERAVVSDVAGTTRDVLAEPLVVPTTHGPAEVMLVDLAGLDDVGAEHDDATMHRHMQHAAHAALARAELILWCTPRDDDAPDRTLPAIPVRRVRTKTDAIAVARAAPGDVAVSARTGAGLDDLRATIGQAIGDRAVGLAGDALVLLARHDAALRSALANLDDAARTLGMSPSRTSITDPELVAAGMRAALDDLAGLVGDITPDDVLGRVFASFCVGK